MVEGRPAATPHAMVDHDDSGTFTSPKTRKRRHRTHKGVSSQNKISPKELFERSIAELDAEESGKWITEVETQLHDIMEEGPRIVSCLCLGLGSPTASRSARAQLALLLRLCHAIDLDRQRVGVFDPVLSAKDIVLLTELGLKCLTSEEASASHTRGDASFLFMPHCDIHVYEAVLRANWSPVALSRIYLLGNTLTDYITNTPAQRLVATHPCVVRLAPLLLSNPVRAPEPLFGAFNNTAFQRVRIEDLPVDEESETRIEFWTLPRSPAELSE